MTELKAALRAEALSRRAALSPEARSAASQAAADRFVAALGEHPGVVAVFSSIGDEIDTAPLIAGLTARGHTLALPVVRGRGQPLLFRAWAPGDPTEARQWGIREPTADAPEVDPDTLACPLAAFDAALNRIGYGAGYYDMTLAGLRARKPVRAIGFAFACQQVPTVPAAPHDERLDAVVTESGTHT